MRLKKVAFIAAALLAGCASSGPVQISKDTYFISKQSAGGLFVQPSAIRVEIIREAALFCSNSGKVLQLNSFNDKAAVPGRNMPSSEIYFMCLDENDPEVARVKMKKEADAVVEIR